MDTFEGSTTSIGHNIRRHLYHVRTRRNCNEDNADIPELMDTLPREIPEGAPIDANEEVRESPTITSSNDISCIHL